MQKALTFFVKSFWDSRGVPDGGRISQFVSIGLLVVMVFTGLLHAESWPPAYIFITVASIATGQSVSSAIENWGKNRAEADTLIARAQALGEANKPAENIVTHVSGDVTNNTENVIIESP